jgi:hypothetical protein
MDSFDDTAFRSHMKRVEALWEERHRLLSRTDEVNQQLHAIVGQCFTLLRHPLDYGVLPLGQAVFASPLGAIASFTNICSRLKLLPEDELCALYDQCRTALLQQLANGEGYG